MASAWNVLRIGIGHFKGSECTFLLPSKESIDPIALFGSVKKQTITRGEQSLSTGECIGPFGTMGSWNQ